MQDIDNEFFDEYKKLDKICGEILNCTNGVSAYILQMDNSSSKKYKISTWNDDYRELKRLRCIRNELAHNTYNYAISTQDDLKSVKSFYERIMKQEDPFAHLRRLEEMEKKREKDKEKDKEENKEKNKVSSVQNKQVLNNKPLYEKITFDLNDDYYKSDQNSSKLFEGLDKGAVISLLIIFAIACIIMRIIF